MLLPRSGNDNAAKKTAHPTIGRGSIDKSAQPPRVQKGALRTDKKGTCAASEFSATRSEWTWPPWRGGYAACSNITDPWPPSAQMLTIA